MASLLQQQVDCQGWRLVITGHSLGGGAAALVALKLRAAFPGAPCCPLLNRWLSSARPRSPCRGFSMRVRTSYKHLTGFSAAWVEEQLLWWLSSCVLPSLVRLAACSLTEPLAVCRQALARQQSIVDQRMITGNLPHQ